jgi:hypothetical protein
VASVQQCQPSIKIHDAAIPINSHKEGELSGHVLPNSAEVTPVNDCELLANIAHQESLNSHKEGQLSGHVLPNSAVLTPVTDCELLANIAHQESPGSRSPREGQACNQAIDVTQLVEVEQLAQQISLLAQEKIHSKQPDPLLEAITSAKAEHDAFKQKASQVRTRSAP